MQAMGSVILLPAVTRLFWPPTKTNVCLFVICKAKLQILKGEIHIRVHNVLGDKKNVGYLEIY